MEFQSDWAGRWSCTWIREHLCFTSNQPPFTDINPNVHRHNIVLAHYAAEIRPLFHHLKLPAFPNWYRCYIHSRVIEYRYSACPQCAPPLTTHTPHSIRSDIALRALHRRNCIPLSPIPRRPGQKPLIVPLSPMDNKNDRHYNICPPLVNYMIILILTPGKHVIHEYMYMYSWVYRAYEY